MEKARLTTVNWPASVPKTNPAGWSTDQIDTMEDCLKQGMVKFEYKIEQDLQQDLQQD